MLGSDCDDGAGSDPQHCWTDYFLVGTTQSFGDWHQPNGIINCEKGPGDTCHQDVQNATQSCTTYTWEVSDAISAKFGAEEDGIGAELGFTVPTTTGEDDQHCNTNIMQTGCT
jgi:hypothetical protein